MKRTFTRKECRQIRDLLSRGLLMSNVLYATKRDVTNPKNLQASADKAHKDWDALVGKAAKLFTKIGNVSK